MEFQDLWYQKTRIPGQSYDVVCMNRVLIELVTYDRQMDRRTDMMTVYTMLA